MTELELLIPKAPVGITTVAGVIGSGLAGVTFSNTIGLGSIVTAAVIVIVAGVFTLRNNLKSFWKELAEERGEQVKVLEEKLAETHEQLVEAQISHTQEMAAFAEEQREVRHQLKNELAVVNGQLKVEQAKHDLSVVIARLDQLDDGLIGKGRFDELVGVITDQSTLLEQIRDGLARRAA
jgi:Flp pilus assembly pilin Flp